MIGAAIQTPPYPLACNALPIDSVLGVVAPLRNSRGKPRIGRRQGRARGDRPGFRSRLACRSPGMRGTFRSKSGYIGWALFDRRSGVAGDRASEPLTTIAICWSTGLSSSTPLPSVTPAMTTQASDSSTQRSRRATSSSSGTSACAFASMAMLRAPAGGVSRIGPVFTPRGPRGVGDSVPPSPPPPQLAVHRSVTRRRAVRRSRQPCFQCHLSERIGFEPVADSVRIDFGAEDLDHAGKCGPRTVKLWRRPRPAPQVVSAIGSGGCSARARTGIRPRRWRRSIGRQSSTPRPPTSTTSSYSRPPSC